VPASVTPVTKPMKEVHATVAVKPVGKDSVTVVGALTVNDPLEGVPKVLGGVAASTAATVNEYVSGGTFANVMEVVPGATDWLTAAVEAPVMVATIAATTEPVGKPGVSI
jgi:hypothetical protein